MEFTGSFQLPAARETVWAALNDAERLGRCIPGCDHIERLSTTEMAAKVTAKIGPVKARFSGRVEIKEANPPQGYTLCGEGQGAAAGFAKGSARITLTETDQGGTELSYSAEALLGGKLAQIGSRLVRGSVEKLSRAFFEALAAELGGTGSAVDMLQEDDA